MDAFLGFLNNPFILTLATLGFGFAVKYWPPLAGVKNWLIPFLNALIAFLVKVLGTTTANADSLDVVHTSVVQAAGAGFLGIVVASVWQAIQSGLVYEFFFRHYLEAQGIKGAAVAKKRGH